MKKFLLLATTALMGFASAFAQEGVVKRYAMGDVVNSEADLTSGLYFIRAHANNANGDMSRGEAMVYDYGNNQLAAGISSTYTWPTGSTDNTAYIWKLEVIEENLPAGATGTKVFTVQNLGTEAFWSVAGNNGRTPQNPAKGSIIKDTFDYGNAGDNEAYHVPGQYQLVAMPESYTKENYYGNQKESTRFFLQITNATGNYPAAGGAGYPMLHSNTTTPVSIGYWINGDVQGTAVQFDLVKAEEVNEVSIIVNYPALNGVAIEPQTITAPFGKDPSNIISNYANENLDNGGFTLTGISSADGNIAMKEGQEFTVEGKWDRQMVPGQVYRMRIRPATDACGTIRYMISTGAIETRRENASETLNRLVPERLWYFTESGEGDNKTYTLHTIYDTSKAIKFTQKNGSWNNATASLEDEGTDLDFFGLNNGYFTMKINGIDNSWFNDFGGYGYLSIYSHNVSNIFSIEDGSRLLLYPLTDEDFAELANFATEAEINAAKANPTVENVKPIIDAYNANNIEAALKRVSYITSKSLGTNPGQYSDPTGEFAEAVNRLNQLAENPDADPEEVQAAIAAVNSMIEGMTESQLTFNEMKPGFYRFKTALSSGRYLSALNGGKAANRDAMAMTDDNTRSNTVFYVQDNGTQTDDGLENYTVICYDNGLVLPNLNGASSWMPALQGDANASENVNFNYQNNGCYLIHVGVNSANGGHRHFHGGTGNMEVANAGGGTDQGYQWHIERVTELPVTFFNVMGQEGYSDDGWASVYSPVALEIPAHYEHMTAYTGAFDGTDYTDKADINHVLATPIAPNAAGKIIIPANQPALLFYDGELSPEKNDNINQSLMENRSHITYINLPIVENYPATEDIKGNLKGACLATSKVEGKEYYTLHASHSNNFREYSEYETGYSYIPGFKAYIENDPDGVDYYSIYLVNPNTMAPDVESEGVKVEQGDSEGQWKVTITTPGEDFEVYYKHTPANDVQDVRHKAHEAEGYTKADNTTDTHTFSVTPGKVEYHTYHPATDTQSVERVFTINADGSTTNLKNVIINANGKAECFDLMGRRLAAPVKGINIVNNKKVLVK